MRDIEADDGERGEVDDDVLLVSGGMSKVRLLGSESLLPPSESTGLGMVVGVRERAVRLLWGGGSIV